MLCVVAQILQIFVLNFVRPAHFNIIFNLKFKQSIRTAGEFYYTVVF